MPSKMQNVEPNTEQGGNNMQCIFCGKNFKPVDEDQDVCDKCAKTAEELSNGKGDDDE